jgi:EAL domain-containing protein (putative c-di-GMP-specific phosphodiesterase class I)
MISDEKKFFFRFPGGEALLCPRFELITDFVGSHYKIYELLCSVSVNDRPVDPSFFFSILTENEIFLLYARILKNVDSHKVRNVSINVSARFITLGYCDGIISMFPKLNFFFELPESCSMKDYADLNNFIKSCNSGFSCNIVLDDFGSFYSNFDVLRQVSFYAVKLSKEFFWDSFSSDRDFLIETIKYLRRKTNVVVIEGVDTIDKYLFCRTHRVFMQGYFFSEECIYVEQ